MDCTKCGVVLCEKNWLFSKLYFECRHCKRNSKMCRMKYPTSLLNNYSLKQNENLDSKLWRVRNPETYKRGLKKINQRRVDKIKDGYVRGILVNTLKILKENITPELIEVKRNQIKLKRWLKQTSS